MRIPRTALLATCLSGPALLHVTTALGQAPPAAPAATPQTPGASSSAALAPKQNSTVEEVIVTAQKRRERSLDVPAAVNTLSGQDLVDTQATHLTDYLSRIPGASFNSQQEGYTQPVIRGIATGARRSPWREAA